MKNAFKLLFLTVVLSCTQASAQKTINWYRVTNDTSALNYNPGATGNVIKMSYYNINPKTGEQMRYVGNNTWVRDSVFNLKNSSLSQTTTDYSPDQFGAVHALKTFAQLGINQERINLMYPGIAVTTSDYVDWAAWQMAVKTVSSNGGGIKALGGVYYLGPKSITIEKYAKNFCIDGNYSRLVSTGSSPIFTRPSPNDNSDANVMVELKCTFKNITMKGTSSQTGIDIGPTYGAVYESIFGENLAECIHIRFGLRTTVENCFSTNCSVGWVADRGNWAGSSNSNSQSNHTTFRSCRFFGSGDAGIKVIAASGCVVEDCIVEGQSVRAGIDFDGQGSTVVKDFTVRNSHFECANGSTQAFLKIRMHSGMVTLDKAYGQYASILVDAGATTGYLTVKITNMSFWVMLGGKAFNNAGNVSWIFENNDNPFQTSTPSTTVPTWFNGTAPSLCGGPGCGSNRFFYTGVPR